MREGAVAARTLGGLAVLVLDEADMLLSFGHEGDLQAIAPLVHPQPARFRRLRLPLQAPPPLGMARLPALGRTAPRACYAGPSSLRGFSSDEWLQGRTLKAFL